MLVSNVWCKQPSSQIPLKQLASRFHEVEVFCFINQLELFLCIFIRAAGIHLLLI